MIDPVGRVISVDQSGGEGINLRHKKGKIKLMILPMGEKFLYVLEVRASLQCSFGLQDRDAYC